MRINFRELKRGDVERVVNLYSSVLHPSYISYGEITEGLAASTTEFSKDVSKKFEKYIRDSLRKKDRTVVLAFADNFLLGFICVDAKKAIGGHTECWISDLGVGKSHRRSGVAKRLMKEAMEWGRKHKARYYFLESGYTNTSAHKLFESEGFRPLNVVYMKIVDRK